ncbi:MAG: class I SAM-dependent methyltransferase [Pseudomonadota bacterium]|nr:class I SAM-dependent methyltransferase [Pseudomonadota bacterium]
MIDEHYCNPKLAALFDSDCPWGEDKDFYLALPKLAQSTILDIGCGTGQLSEAYASLGHNVLGIDPAAAMLEVARSKPHGSIIEWQQASAQNFATPHKFDLIVMTGHVFQTLLNVNDVDRSLARIAAHLKPGGQFVFESRTPNIDWFAKWKANVEIGREFIAIADTPSRKTFERKYILPDQTHVSRSELQFWSEAEIRQQLSNTGLVVRRFLGDWSGNDFDPNKSEEMIFVTSLS